MSWQSGTQAQTSQPSQLQPPQPSQQQPPQPPQASSQQPQQQPNNWYPNNPNFTNYAAYGYPMPGVNPANGQSTPGWTYNYANYYQGQSWPFGFFPNCPPPPPATESGSKSSSDASSVKPPLPPVPPPPPSESPKEERKKEKKKKSKDSDSSKKEKSKSSSSSSNGTSSKKSSKDSSSSSSGSGNSAAATPYPAFPFPLNQPPPPPPQAWYYPNAYSNQNFQNMNSTNTNQNPSSFQVPPPPPPTTNSMSGPSQNVSPAQNSSSQNPTSNTMNITMSHPPPMFQTPPPSAPNSYNMTNRNQNLNPQPVKFNFNSKKNEYMTNPNSQKTMEQLNGFSYNSMYSPQGKTNERRPDNNENDNRVSQSHMWRRGYSGETGRKGYQVEHERKRSDSPPPKPKVKPTPKPGKGQEIGESEWPPSLRRYVQKCFERCMTDVDKDQVEICLKGKLTRAARNETLWSWDWDAEPLIGVFSRSSGSDYKKERTPKTDSYHQVGGDPSRGFALYKKSRSRTRSRSRSRTPDHRRKRVRRRYDSSQSYGSEDRESDYLSLNAKDNNNRRGGRGRFRGRGSHSHQTNQSQDGDSSGGILGLGSNTADNNNENNNRRGGGFRGRGGRFGQKNRISKSNNNNNYAESGESESAFYSRGGAAMSLDADLKTDAKLEERAARFAGMTQQTPKRGRGRGGRGARGAKKAAFSVQPTPAQFTIDENTDWTKLHVVGTCTTVLKQYLRLTSAPDPASVRTLPTLALALDHVKKEWVKGRDYLFTCNQFKSIRQDLTVQGIRNDFTIKVYEAHCRVALEKGDHQEFNQCQTQLKYLYHDIPAENVREFTAYRLLYYIFTKSHIDITSTLASFTKEDKKDECISFALKFRSAWSLSNYKRMFTLYQKAPKMSGYLIDWFMKREREKAISVIVRSYRPGNICSRFVQSTLSMSEEEWAGFVEEYNLVFSDQTKNFINCKLTVIAS